MPHLFGNRIRLRAPEKTDLETFCRWVNDPEVTENLMLVYPMSRLQEEGWFDKMLATPPSEHVLVIDARNPEKPKDWLTIGNCQYICIDWRSRSGEVGIMIGEKQFWDQGYGTETMRLLLAHGFNTLNLHRVWLQVFSKNPRAIHAYEKAGFIHEGCFRQAHYQHGQYHDIQLMSVLKPEWHQAELADQQA